MTSYLGAMSVPKMAFRALATSVAVFLLGQFVSLYLSWPKQLVLGGITVSVVLILNRRSKSQATTITLMLLSLVTTLRYGWWRIHLIADFFGDESNHRATMSGFLMLLLLAAEAYTVVIMLLGYMQTVAPLHRKPVPLPSDISNWPHVDVLIPTFNEPLSLVRYTALAAINMDYPPDKLHVYILDDGTREDFRSFCEQANVGYIIRLEHEHAKAGNINHALTQMNSSLIAIFDCDHVPTRSFLEISIGWFLADEKLAMLQTPHHFYSPDPFERNLLRYKTIPNEGELFYGLIQDGNDLWNATFFCGSCAVIRRVALDEVGGVATETVTEDAHTSLRMQNRGWDTAYINIPQAAGLATGTLSAHVGQRIRWARGMIQIFRTENPLFAFGMKIPQRLCYFNAMLHFLYAVPRLIFLCAPLAYLLFRWTILPGYWFAILAYGLPHLAVANLTNSRVQGKYRHSFWNEIYETVLAPYILVPTLLALIDPKLGKFNVTDKAGMLKETTFDRHVAAPTIVLLLLNLLGVCMVPYRLLVTDSSHPGAVLSNLAWILFNLVILGVAAAVADEQQQRRASTRIPATISIHLQAEDGAQISGMTSDISVGGASLLLYDVAMLPVGSHFMVSFPDQTGETQVEATMIGEEGPRLRLKFNASTIADQEMLTRVIYSRADAWIDNHDGGERDRPAISLARVIRLSFTGFHQIIDMLLTRRKVAVALLVLLLLAAPLSGAQALTAQNPQTNAFATLDETNATDKITLKDMGVQNAIEMHGPHSYSSVGFALPYTGNPRMGKLNLSYHFSAAILPNAGSIKVTVNKALIGTIMSPETPQQDGQYGFVSLPILPDFLVRNNDITFEFIGSAALRSPAHAGPATLASIGADSELLVAADPLPMTTDLSLLPLPIFDSELQTTTTVPLVFLTAPTPKMLQAAAVVASWLGVQVRSKPVRFSVSIGTIPKGNVVILANSLADLTASMQVPSTGASLNVRPNPSDSDGTVLIVSGNGDEELLRAARGLASRAMHDPLLVGQEPLLGDTVRLGDEPGPSRRRPDDAPRWMTTESLQPLWTDVSEPAMPTDGSIPIAVYFRLPPDLYYGETENLKLKLSYRFNARPIAEGSAMRIYINGWLVNEAALAPGNNTAGADRPVRIPAEKMRPFSNTMLVNFDFIARNRDAGGQTPARPLQGEVLRASSIDLRGLAHWVSMPNLELFSNAGFPFTRMADLSETVIVMPSIPSEKEVALLLDLMGHFGAQTGYPSLRVEIAGPDAVLRDDRDYLVLGDVSNQPAFGTIADFLPVALDIDGLHRKQTGNRLESLLGFWRSITGRHAQQNLPGSEDGLPYAVLEGAENPNFAGRSIVAIAVWNDDAVDRFADVFQDRSQSSDIAQTVSILSDKGFTSYNVPTGEYHIGYISDYALIRLRLAQHTWLLLIVIVGFCLLLAEWARDYLSFVAARRLQAAETNLVDQRSQA